ncbi:hypothetical protein [Metapseudomonas furukawaii]|uniref:hypothetical protein n=1 Tax=Metapseudomonas furukawaii TaxID=1149133 RepID=UPI00056637B3|nr:hypothetical protein [Pseudomonas furukawaii]
MRWLLLLMIAIFVMELFPAETGGEEYSQRSRNEQQDELLVQLTAMKDPLVDEFVRDWLAAFPSPSAAKLSELRVIAARINADASQAERFTVRYRRNASISSQVRPIVGFGAEEVSPSL